jgi:hypothetical protein
LYDFPVVPGFNHRILSSVVAPLVDINAVN